MSEEPQHDPNVPDPTRPWCPKCEGHMPFDSNTTRSLNGGETTSNYCRNCGILMSTFKDFTPLGIKIVRCFSYGLIITYCVTTFFAFIENAKLGMACTLIGIIMGVAFYLFSIFSRRRKKAWLTWAKERGYVEQT